MSLAVDAVGALTSCFLAIHTARSQTHGSQPIRARIAA